MTETTKASKEGYTEDQIRDAEKMAAFLKEQPESKRNFLVAMGLAYISGFEAGIAATK